MRILMIEDDTAMAGSLRATLQSRGFNVYVADTAEEGVDLARIYDYDAVLLDLGLPDMSGNAVIAHLKQEPSTQDIPIVVCTADDREETAEACRAAGCIDVLLKPFSSEQLLDVVGRILRARPNNSPSGPISAA